MGSLRVGVIGMGYMGDAHARIYNAMPNVELVGCVEQSDERRAFVGRELGFNVYATSKELYEQGVDAVSICTPDQLHKEYILEAFQNKVKVLVEKPLAMSVQDCQEIIDNRPDKTYLCVGHDVRFDARVQAAKKLVDSGQLGDLLLVDIHRNNSVAGAEKLSGRCSITWFLGIHDIDIINYITGQKVTKIDGVKGFKHYSNNWDCVCALMTLGKNTMLTMQNHWILPNTHTTQCDAGIKIIGTKGMFESELGFREAWFTPMEGDGTRYFDSHYQPDDMCGVPGGDLRYEVEAFVNAVRNNKIPPITAEDGYEAVRVISLIEDALEEQTR